MTIIDLAQLTLPVDRVSASIASAVMVRNLNGNRNDAHKTIQLITDDVDVMCKHTTISGTDLADFDECLGLTFHRPRGYFIWLSPLQRFSNGNTSTPPYDLALTNHRARVVETLVHELAHAMVGGRRGHGWTFRRMYVLLIEFVGNRVFADWVGRTYDPHKHAYNVISRYQRTGEYHRPGADDYRDAWSWSGQRRDEEVDKHMKALGRMIKRVGPSHVIGLYT